MSLSSSRLTSGNRRTQRAGTAMDRRRKSWRTTVLEDAAFRRVIRQGSTAAETPARTPQKAESEPFVPLAYQKSQAVLNQQKPTIEEKYRAALVVIQRLHRRVAATESALFAALPNKSEFRSVITQIKIETAG